MQRVDELEHRLRRVWLAIHGQKASKLSAANMRLGAQSPAQQMERHRSQLDALASRLDVAVQNQQHLAKSRFDILARALHGVSPLAVLDRGYAIVKKNETPVTNISAIQTGDEITTRLANGELVAIVSKTKLIEN